MSPSTLRRCSARGERWSTAIRGTGAGTVRGGPASRSAAGDGVSDGIRGTIPGTARGDLGTARGTIPGTGPDGAGGPDGTADTTIIPVRDGAADTDGPIIRILYGAPIPTPRLRGPATGWDRASEARRRDRCGAAEATDGTISACAPTTAAVRRGTVTIRAVRRAETVTTIPTVIPAGTPTTAAAAITAAVRRPTTAAVRRREVPEAARAAVRVRPLRAEATGIRADGNGSLINVKIR